jgi:hypothetical protein
MLSIGVVLMILAMVCFLVAALGGPWNNRFNLVALGLFFWALAIVLGSVGGISFHH